MTPRTTPAPLTTPRAFVLQPPAGSTAKLLRAPAEWTFEPNDVNWISITHHDFSGRPALWTLHTDVATTATLVTVNAELHAAECLEADPFLRGAARVDAVSVEHAVHAAWGTDRGMEFATPDSPDPGDEPHAYVRYVLLHRCAAAVLPVLHTTDPGHHGRGTTRTWHHDVIAR
ncbi:hypothetical protein ACFC1T_09295 [Kitasatospora sp. NPDC056076]|uniref:hypothetical protein n=1 Tax=Kitasatospora sp. NPDC056076 TaxID=3345703 RepID=UPI0035DA1637